jgi:hypothetical protein
LWQEGIAVAKGKRDVSSRISFYPGYHAEACVRDIVAGTIYALVDGAIAGLVFASIYNLVAGGKESPA